jgi:hypothetical protein
MGDHDDADPYILVTATGKRSVFNGYFEVTLESGIKRWICPTCIYQQSPFAKLINGTYLERIQALADIFGASVEEIRVAQRKNGSER